MSNARFMITFVVLRDGHMYLCVFVCVYVCACVSMWRGSFYFPNSPQFMGYKRSHLLRVRVDEFQRIITVSNKINLFRINVPRKLGYFLFWKPKLF